jgi:hypothetical protein
MAALPQDSEIPRRGYGQLGASAREYLVLLELMEHPIERVFISEALQYLAENYVN